MRSFLADNYGISISAPCITRWNSYYAILKSFIQLKTIRYESELLIDYICNKKKIYHDFSDDWVHIVKIKQTLEPIAEGLTLLESENYTTINLVLVVIFTIIKKWKATLTNDLNKYCDMMEYYFKYKDPEEMHIFVLGASVDPVFKSFFFIQDLQLKEYYKEYSKKIMFKEINNISLSLEDESTNSGDSFLFGNVNMVLSTSEEWNSYYQLNVEKIGFDVLQFWKNNETFKRIKNIAKKILCVQASSAASERIFSKTNMIVSKLVGKC